MKSLILILLALFFIYSCGTGPWIVRKNIYKTYKEPVYNKNKYKLRTDGYYIQLGELSERSSVRELIVFLDEGYVTDVWLNNKNFKDELNKFKNTTTINTDLNWWKVDGDSIVIEHYAEQKIEMWTWNFFERGRFLNDSIIELQYEDSPYNSIKYKFVQSDSLPVFINTGRYLEKEWYRKGLHKSRE